MAAIAVGREHFKFPRENVPWNEFYGVSPIKELASKIKAVYADFRQNTVRTVKR